MIEAREQPCPNCGAMMIFEVRDDVAAYEGHARRTPTEAWWCNACGEAIFAGAALLNSERVFRELKAEVDALSAVESSPAPKVVRNEVRVATRSPIRRRSRAMETFKGLPRTLKRRIPESNAA